MEITQLAVVEAYAKKLRLEDIRDIDKPPSEDLMQARYVFDTLELQFLGREK
jgi:hypothetical protein